MTMPSEPSAARLANPLLRYLLATRPAFLTITAVGVVLGWACVWRMAAAFDGLAALLTLVFALVAHAGANVINDFHDQDSDALNRERLFPFTGGSRFIQNGVLSAQAIALFGYGLLAAVVPAGLWLVWRSGARLLGIGLAGLLLGWTYSSPPLRLSARGWGELAVALGWALVVVGSDYVQRGVLSPQPLAAGLAFGLMVANLLYINQFPDATADAAAGKHTLVARLGRRRAVGGYGLILAATVAIIVTAVTARLLAPLALICLIAVVPALAAYGGLRRHAEQPAALRPAIGQTLLAAHAFGLLLAVAMIFG